MISIDRDTRVVVTGPTGAVGNALVAELLACGAHVIAVCRPGSKRLSSMTGKPGVDVVECDLADYASLKDVLPQSCDVFYHLAWAGTSGPARQDWTMQANNVRYAMDAVQVAHEIGCKVFVGVGSQAEYGAVSDEMKPNGPCNPETGYGAAKLAAKEMTRAYCAHVGMRHEWCRILSLYGPGDSERSLVMDVVHTLINGERPSCTPCDQLWDYIYSKDAARAMRLVAEKGKTGETYLIASGITRPLREFVCDIRDVVDAKAEIGFGERGYYPNQAMLLKADISNLRSDTGFEIEHSFKDGILETVEWVKAQRDAEGRDS